ncbi:MAG: RNA polymerase sigma factor [Parcubacteria group bacterium]|nr:RNA polymerase sigma factor [Parcubacteria group bacterium]
MHLFNRFNTKKVLDVTTLVKEAKSGDSKAFGVLYEQYAPGIYRFTLLKTSSREDTEDLVHQTFLKAWDNIQYYEDRGASFQAWLYSIARNTVIDYYRTKKTTATLASYTRNPFEEQKIFEYTESNVEFKMLKQHIAELTHTEQDALLLRYVEDLDHRTIAQMLLKSENATKVLIHRAIAKLKQKLDPR